MLFYGNMQKNKSERKQAALLWLHLIESSIPIYEQEFKKKDLRRSLAVVREWIEDRVGEDEMIDAVEVASLATKHLHELTARRELV